MKFKLYISTLVAALLIVACKQTVEKETTAEESVSIDYREDGLNQMVPETVDGGEMLLGLIDRKELESPRHADWFNNSYSEHRLDSLRVDSITPLLAGVDIKIFMGSWCEDSQREVPALMRILDMSGYDSSTIEMIAIDHDKHTPDQKEEGYDVEYIPTIIFSRDGKELNRIVEYPVNTLEMDMLRILREQPYKHYYED